MRLALRELWRRPKGFSVPAAILLLLSIMLLYPTAVLDGLYHASTGALRTLGGDLIVFNLDAHRSMLRSHVDTSVRGAVSGVAGVEKVTALNAIPLPATIEGKTEPVGVALIGTEKFAPPPLVSGPTTGPNEPASAIADLTLKEQGVVEGTILMVGPLLKVPLKVVGFTEDTGLLLQGGLLVDPATWRKILLVSDEGSQVLVVDLADGADADQVATNIDAATAAMGTKTDTAGIGAAIRALPGIEQQDATFGYIRIVTLAVSFLVVGLFLSFVTLERTPLYAVLKAVGASSRQLFTGLISQVLLVALFSVAVAVVIALVMTLAIPIGLPTTMRVSRIIETTIGLSLTAAIGSALSLKRVVRIDPASAIG